MTQSTTLTVHSADPRIARRNVGNAVFVVAFIGVGWFGMCRLLGTDSAASIAVVLSIAAVLFVTLATHPMHGLVLLILTLPLVSFGVIEVGWSVRPAQIVTMALLTVGMLATRTDWKRIPCRPWLLLYAASLVFASLWALAQPTTTMELNANVAQRASTLRPVVQLFTSLLSLGVLPIVLLYVDSEHRLSTAIKTLVGITCAVALYGLYQPFAVAFGWPLSDITWSIGSESSVLTNYGATRFYSGIVTGFAPRATFAESLHLGAYLAGILPLCMACWLGRASLPNHLRRWPWRTISFLLTVVLFLTFSRSSWVAAAIGLLIVLLLARSKRAWLSVIAGAGLLYVAFLAITALPIFDDTLSPLELIKHRMAIDYLIHDPRVLYLNTLSGIALAHPIYGVGLGQFALLGASQLGLSTILSAHGVWAAHWVEGGLIGLFCVLGLFVAIGRTLWRNIKSTRHTTWHFPLIGLCAGIAAMAAQYLTWGDRFEPYFWFVIGLALAIGGLAKRSASFH